MISKITDKTKEVMKYLHEKDSKLEQNQTMMRNMRSMQLQDQATITML